MTVCETATGQQLQRLEGHGSGVAALAFAIAVSYAVALTVAVTEGIKGMVTVAESLDDVAKTTIDSGLNIVDNVVDAVDGPDRHGIR